MRHFVGPYGQLTMARLPIDAGDKRKKKSVAPYRAGYGRGKPEPTTDHATFDKTVPNRHTIHHWDQVRSDGSILPRPM